MSRKHQVDAAVRLTEQQGHPTIFIVLVIIGWGWVEIISLALNVDDQVVFRPPCQVQTKVEGHGTSSG